MKKSLLVLLALVPVFFFSCNKEKPEPEPEPDPAALTVETTAFNAEKGDGEISVPIEANYSSIKVAVADDAKDWLYFVSTTPTKAEMVPYTVKLGYRANPTVKERKGTVTITLDNIAKNVTVTQAAGDAFLTLEVESVKVNPRGMTMVIPFSSNDEVNLSTDASWITAGNAVEGGLEIVAASNTTGEARTAEVVFSTATDKDCKASVTVLQKGFNIDPNAISILSIGNAAATAALDSLPVVLEKLGYTKIRVGNLYKGDTKLAEHAELIASEEEGAYKYASYEEGKWVVTDTVAFGILEPEDWDVIVLQEATAEAAKGNAGLAETVAAIRETNPFTPLAWSIAWAPTGAANQGEVFEEIVDAVVNTVSESKEFDYIIPVGTAIQNLRTTFFQDNVGSGNNLSANIGVPAATLTWAAVLTGKTVNETLVCEAKGYEYEIPYKPAIVESVNSAVKTPFAVTESGAYAPIKTAIADKAAANAAINAAGFNAGEYVEVPVTVVYHAYWASTSSPNIYVAWAGTTGDTKNSFVSTVKLQRNSIPVGTLIYVASGYQYRPEGWQSVNANNSAARPDNTSETVVEVTPDWWGNFNYRAFNVSKTEGTIEYGELGTVAGSFGLFVPKTAISGGLEDYGQGDWNW